MDSLVGGATAKPSALVEAFVKGWERCVLKPYLDSGYRWTVGWGHLMQPTDDRETTITQDEADALFHCDLQYAGDGVARLIFMPLTQFQYDGLVAFAFNVGLGNLAGSTLRKRVNGGYFDEAALQFCVWDKERDSSGAYVESKGLAKRRAAERAIFQLGDYSGRP